MVLRGWTIPFRCAASLISFLIIFIKVYPWIPLSVIYSLPQLILFRASVLNIADCYVTRLNLIHLLPNAWYRENLDGIPWHLLCHLNKSNIILEEVIKQGHSKEEDISMKNLSNTLVYSIFEWIKKIKIQ